MDKFSKWIEACPISKIKSDQAVLFFTASSLTKTHNSPAKNSLSYAMTTMSAWTSQQWLTQRQMAKLNVPMA
jgi:hypothetical protein